MSETNPAQAHSDETNPEQTPIERADESDLAVIVKYSASLIGGGILTSLAAMGFMQWRQYQNSQNLSNISEGISGAAQSLANVVANIQISYLGFVVGALSGLAGCYAVRKISSINKRDYNSGF